MNLSNNFIADVITFSPFYSAQRSFIHVKRKNEGSQTNREIVLKWLKTNLWVDVLKVWIFLWKTMIRFLHRFTINQLLLDEWSSKWSSHLLVGVHNLVKNKYAFIIYNLDVFMTLGITKYEMLRIHYLKFSSSSCIYSYARAITKYCFNHYFAPINWEIKIVEPLLALYKKLPAVVFTVTSENSLSRNPSSVFH